VSLTYVYCLFRSARRPVLRDHRSRPWWRVHSIRRRRPAVVGGRQQRAGRDFSEDALRRGLQDLNGWVRRAMAHEAVVERFLVRAALLPMQLFTLFTSDERLDRVRASGSGGASIASCRDREDTSSGECD
jgi:hypothetical protein